MSNERLDKLRSLKTHPWLKRLFKKITADEMAFMESIVVANASLDRGQFELMVNRLFMDKPKPKNWKHILEALGNSNCI